MFCVELMNLRRFFHLQIKNKKKYSSRFANVHLLLIVCLLPAFLCAAFWNFKASAQQQAPANHDTAPSPTPIPPSSIVAEREKIENRLQEINRRISEQSPVPRTQIDLTELADDVDAHEQEANEMLAADQSLETLDKIENYWATVALSLPSRKSRLAAQATEISALSSELQNNQLTWNLTKQSIEGISARPANENLPPGGSGVDKSNVNAGNTADGGRGIGANANANSNVSANSNANANGSVSAQPSPEIVFEVPENLREQVNGTVEAIKQTRTVVQANLSEIIRLQQKLSGIEKRTDDMLNRIDVTRNALLSNLVVRDAPPIWGGDTFRFGFREEAGTSFAERFGELRTYLSERRGILLLHLLIFLALIFAFRWARRKTRLLVEEEPKLKTGLVVFETPVISALILSLLFNPVLYWRAPDLLEELASPVLVIAVFLLLRRLVERPFLPILIALVILYLVNDLRIFTLPVPLLTRLIFLTQMLGGIVVLVWLIRANPRRQDSARPAPGFSKLIRRASMVLLVPFAFALLANVFGYVGLARVCARVLVSSLSLGLVLYALVRIADSLFTFVFRVRPFSKLGMVKTHRTLIQNRVSKIVKWLAILLWLIFSLTEAYLFDPLINGLEKVLTYEIGIGTIGISLGGILTIVLILWFSSLLSRFILFTLEEDVYPRVHLASGLPYATSTILHYVLLLGGFLLALMATGIDLTKFTIFLGALGVGVGIGLQNIVLNFTSGLILLVERPVTVGDSIQMEQHQGELKRIGLRASIVKTSEGAEIIVPNGQLITREVTNWTPAERGRRLDINVGVKNGADPEKVIRLLENVAKAHPGTDAGVAPRALFLGFGDNALNFQLRAWTSNREDSVVIKSDLGVGIHKALKEAGIQIP